MSSLSLKSRALSAGKKLLDAFDKNHGDDLSWGSAAYVVLTGESENCFGNTTTQSLSPILIKNSLILSLKSTKML